MTVKEKRDIKRKLNLINHAKEIGNVKKACRYFGISRSTYYVWYKGMKNFENPVATSVMSVRLGYAIDFVQLQIWHPA